MSRNLIEDKCHRIHYLWMETSVIFVVCLLPFLFNSFADVYLIKNRAHYTFFYHALSQLVRLTGTVALIIFTIWRSNDSFALFGLRRIRFVADLLGGVCLWIISTASTRLVWILLPMVIGQESFMTYIVHRPFLLSYDEPVGVQEYVLLGLMCLTIGIAEELVVRAYLITRLEEIFGSTIMALACSTVIFASYHGYQGAWGFIRTGILGLISGSAFCVSRRFAPIALAHSLQDFIAFVPII